MSIRRLAGICALLVLPAVSAACSPDLVSPVDTTGSAQAVGDRTVTIVNADGSETTMVLPTHPVR